MISQTRVEKKNPELLISKHLKKKNFRNTFLIRICVTYLIFVRSFKFMDFKNRMHRSLKVNKSERKCHGNCVSGMPE